MTFRLSRTHLLFVALVWWSKNLQETCSCDKYTNCIPHPIHKPKYTKVKVLHTQDKHCISWAELHCHCLIKPLATTSLPEYVATDWLPAPLRTRQLFKIPQNEMLQTNPRKVQFLLKIRQTKNLCVKWYSDRQWGEMQNHIKGTFFASHNHNIFYLYIQLGLCRTFFFGGEGAKFGQKPLDCYIYERQKGG